MVEGPAAGEWACVSGVDRLNIDVKYKDRAILYRNKGRGTFEDISEGSGPGILSAIPHGVRHSVIWTMTA
jgi:hypothetical protein